MQCVQFNLSLPPSIHSCSYFSVYYISESCDIPSDLSYGLIRYSDTTFGSKVTYTCKAGYMMTAGSSSRTCQSNGLWSGSHPTCSRKCTMLCFAITGGTQWHNSNHFLKIFCILWWSWRYKNARRSAIWYTGVGVGWGIRGLVHM